MFEQKICTRIHHKGSGKFNLSPFYPYSHTLHPDMANSIRAPASHSYLEALLLAKHPASAAGTIMSHKQAAIPDWPFL